MLIAIEQAIVERLVSCLEATTAELARVRQQPGVAQADDPIGVEEAAKYLTLSSAAVYQNIDKIPHHKRHNRLLFYKSELRAYVLAGVD